jgi:hypothetical protein
MNMLVAASAVQAANLSSFAAAGYREPPSAGCELDSPNYEGSINQAPALRCVSRGTLLCHSSYQKLNHGLPSAKIRCCNQGVSICNPSNMLA